jgi:outer membrane protein OmpA-like peptidoglycan-associated protein/flagellar hook assembly protein FlgD
MNINKKILFLLILLIQVLFFNRDLNAVSHSGKNLIQYGSSAASMARGGAGVSDNSVEMLFLNPAVVAGFERFNFGFEYGSLTSGYIYPALYVAVPTSYGVIAGSAGYLSVPENAVDVQKMYMFSLGGAKKFTKRLSVGFLFTYMQGQDLNGKLYYPGGVLGINYLLPFYVHSRSGFGIYEPSLGLSAMGGIRIAENSQSEKNIDFNHVTFGYNFDFYRTTFLHLGLYNDVSAMNEYEDYPVKFGVQSLIDNQFILRAGGSAPNSYEYGKYTFGLGYRFTHQYFIADVNYSLVNYRDKNFVHNLGLKVRYGELDRTPPVTKIKSSQKYISPNYDGIKDYTVFDIDVRDVSNIKGWRLQILDSKGGLVKEYRVLDRDIEESMTPLYFVKKIFEKKESTVVPEKIMWDGTDAQGNMVADGYYKYTFFAWDERDNYSVKKQGNVVVDNLAPKVIVQISEKLFSPNNDRKKDKLFIKHKIDRNNSDLWRAGFKNSQGRIVKSFKWTDGKVPGRLFWNGTDSDGNNLPEGLYEYFIYSEDKAGNKENIRVAELTLTRQYEVADLTADREYFSYQHDKAIQFRPILSSTRGIESWAITITDDDGDVVKTFKGGKEFPIELEWAVKDEKGKNIDDGKYYYQLSTVFKSGNTPKSFKKEIIVDSTSPDIDLDFSPGTFSPDGDGKGDILTIEPEASDKYGMKKWDITIINPTGYQFKYFNGTGEPAKEIIWDGLSDKNELVESATDYYIIYSVTDNAGNVAKSKKIKLPVDVLVIVTERGLKIRINNIQFAFDSAKLVGNATKILDRVSSILDRYEKYQIVIEGHTDDIGKEDYNLKLSESRAEAVYKYLLDEGIDEERLTYRGMGETVPFLENTDNESRRKNRRVEFILKKISERELQE